MREPKPIWDVLRRLENTPLDERDHNLLRPAIAALHGGEAMKLPEMVVNRIRALEAQLPKD